MSGHPRRALCLYDFSARQKDELTIKKGAIVAVFSGEGCSEDWWLVGDGQDQNIRGLVPNNYLQLLSDADPPGPAQLQPINAPQSHTRNHRDQGLWCAARDEVSGDTYFFNRDTGESQWDMPSGLPADSIAHMRPEEEDHKWCDTPSPRETVHDDGVVELGETSKQEEISVPLGLARKLSDHAVEEEKPCAVHTDGNHDDTSYSPESNTEAKPPSTNFAVQKHFNSVDLLPEIEPRKTLPLMAKIENVKDSVVEPLPAIVYSAERPVPPRPEEAARGSDTAPADERAHQHCRSKIYPPSTYDATRPFASEERKGALDFGFCFGYNGDHRKYHVSSIGSRPLGGCSNRNIYWPDDSVIMYPVAALVVFMAVSVDSLARQVCFNAHTEEVTAVALCSQRRLVASAQSGRKPRILIWRCDDHLRALKYTERSPDPDIGFEIILDASYRGITDLSLSADANFLAAVTADDVHTLFIYDVTSNSSVPISSIKLGHVEVSHFCFNPIQYAPFRWPAPILSSPAKASTPMKSRSENGEMAGVKQNNKNNISEVQSRFDSCKTHDVADGCYTLFCCINRSVKIWTLHKYKELVDPGVVEVSGFKGRRMAVPRRMQHWVTKYLLGGTLCPLPKSAAAGASSEVTCCCAVRDVDGGSGLPASRLFCGSRTGSVLVWRQTEASPEDDIYTLLNPAMKAKITSKKDQISFPHHLGWLPKGQFLYIITDVHDGPIHDIDFFAPAAEEDIYCCLLLTCGGDNIVNFWRALSSKNCHKGVPIEHIKSVPLRSRGAADSAQKETRQNEILEGMGRTISISPNAATAIVGLTNNSLYRIHSEGTLLNNDALTEANVLVDTLIRGHVGSIKRVASHPTRDIFATIGLDKSLRVWSVSQRKQLGVAYIRDDFLSSLCFSNDGSHVVVGTSTFGNILLFRLDSIAEDENSNSNHFDSITVTLVLRKKIVSKQGKYKKPPVNPGADPSNPRRPEKKDLELIDIRFSPDSAVLAVSCKNGLIYLLSVEEKYRRYAICRTRGSQILRMNFSKDGSIIQVNDTTMALSYWNTDTGMQLTDARHLRDIEWSSWTSTCGWPVQGIHNNSDGSDGSHEHTSVVCRSNDELSVIIGTDNTMGSSIKLCEYPALETCKPSLYLAHSSAVTDVCFSANDHHAISCGGLNDSSIVVWNVIR